MIMRARNEGNVIVFELEGHLDFETTQQMAESCASILHKDANQRIVFNLTKLKFVGSSGINQFIQVIREFNNLNERPRLCHLSSEFQKMFRAYQAARNPFEIYETEAEAFQSFLNAPAVPKAPRKSAKRSTANP